MRTAYWSRSGRSRFPVHSFGGWHTLPFRFALGSGRIPAAVGGAMRIPFLTAPFGIPDRGRRLLGRNHSRARSARPRPVLAPERLQHLPMERTGVCRGPAAGFPVSTCSEPTETQAGRHDGVGWGHFKCSGPATARKPGPIRHSPRPKGSRLGMTCGARPDCSRSRCRRASVPGVQKGRGCFRPRVSSRLTADQYAKAAEARPMQPR